MGNCSGASGMYSTIEDKSLMEGTDRKSGAVEDQGYWRQVTLFRRQRGGPKVRVRMQGSIK